MNRTFRVPASQSTLMALISQSPKPTLSATINPEQNTAPGPKYVPQKNIISHILSSAFGLEDRAIVMKKLLNQLTGAVAFNLEMAAAEHARNFAAPIDGTPTLDQRNEQDHAHRPENDEHGPDHTPDERAAIMQGRPMPVDRLKVAERAMYAAYPLFHLIQERNVRVEEQLPDTVLIDGDPRVTRLVSIRSSMESRAERAQTSRINPQQLKSAAEKFEASAEIIARAQAAQGERFAAATRMRIGEVVEVAKVLLDDARPTKVDRDNGWLADVALHAEDRWEELPWEEQLNYVKRTIAALKRDIEPNSVFNNLRNKLAAAHLLGDDNAVARLSNDLVSTELAIENLRDWSEHHDPLDEDLLSLNAVLSARLARKRAARGVAGLGEDSLPR